MDYISELSGDRKSASTIAATLLTKWKTHNKMQSKDANKRKLQFVVCVVKYIRVALEQNNATHYDIYCDILDNLLPNVANTLSSDPELWSKGLYSLRAVHYHIVFKDVTLANRICKCLANQGNLVNSSEDYKPLLIIYCQQLLALKNVKNNEESAELLLLALAQLFKHMLQSNQSSAQLQYADLITDFNDCLFKNRSKNTLVFICSLPANALKGMFDAFFELLEKMHLPISKEAAENYCVIHLEAFRNFFQVDIQNKLQLQLSLRHLRAIRNVPIMKADKYMHYLINLLYYFNKFIYERVEMPNFQQTQQDIFGKLNRFLSDHGGSLIRQQWFIHAVVIVYIILSSTHLQVCTFFGIYWQQMDNGKDFVHCYEAYLRLMLECIKLTPHIENSTLVKWLCCNNMQGHVIFSFGMLALNCYTNFLKNEQSQLLKACQLTNLNSHLRQIMRATVEQFDQMSCANAETKEFQMFLFRIKELLEASQNSMQCKFAIELTEMLCRVRERFGSSKWQKILRKVCKCAELAEDETFMHEVHSFYVATLMLEHAAADCNQSNIRYAFWQFYELVLKKQSAGNIPPKCLLEWLDQSSSSFKPLLSKAHKRMLTYLELQTYVKQQVKNEQLRNSLLQYCQDDYQLVLLLHLQTEDYAETETTKKLLNKLYGKLEPKAPQLTRLEHLIYAHTCTLLLLCGQCKKVCNNITECIEERLEALFERKDIAAIKMSVELERVELIEKAVEGFRHFYELSSKEMIKIDDAVIDWEPIFQDLSLLGHSLQYAGYMKQASNAWLLLYHIAELLQNDIRIIASLSYFCEQSDMFIHNDCVLNIEAELQKHGKLLVDTEMRFERLSRRKQDILLLCYCHMAYYHSRKGRLNWAQCLLTFVQELHSNTHNEQPPQYDIVMVTSDVVQFRIYWKNLLAKDKYEQYSQAEIALHKKPLICLAVNVLEKLLTVRFTQADNLLYQHLMLMTVLQVAECAANRLCDNFLEGYLCALLKILLQSGNVLRLVQLLTTWTFINLQMEYVDKAEIKLQIVYGIMGLQNTKKIKSQLPNIEKSTENFANVEYLVPSNKLLLKTADLEMVRKVLPTELSPVNVETKNTNGTLMQFDMIKSIQRSNDDKIPHSMQPYEDWECLEMLIRCMQARLYFLAGNYAELEQFYQESINWFEKQDNLFLKQKCQNLQWLLCQHYANYLRATKQFNKALDVIKQTFIACKSSKRNVDFIYSLNAWLQLLATHKEIQLLHEGNDTNKLNETRRALKYDSPPEEQNKQTLSKSNKAATSKKTVPKIFVDSPKCVDTFIDLTTPTSDKSSNEEDSNENVSQNQNAIESVVGTTTRRIRGKTAMAASASSARVATVTPIVSKNLTASTAKSDVPKRRLRKFRI